MKIILLSHMFNNGNLGVGALSIANILIISEACESLEIKPKFYLLGFKGKKLDYSFELDKYGIDYEIIFLSYKKYLLNFFKFYRLFQSSNIIFDIGQGDSFSNIYGNKRFISVLIPELFGIAAKKPLVLSPQTIGPFKLKFANFAARFILNKSKVVFARDHKSFLIAKEYFTRENYSNLKETVDVAMLLPYEKIKKQNYKKILVGLNVSALIYNGGYTRNNQFDLSVDYKKLIIKLINYFKSILNVELILVAHVLGYRKEGIENDFTVCSKLSSEYDVGLAPFFNSPIEAKSYISQFDFFMGARMHATIAAFSSGIPVIPMAYSRKFESLYNGLGYNYVLDMMKSDTAEAFEEIIKYFKNRELLQKDAIKGKEKAVEELNYYKQVLRELLNEYKSVH